MPTITAVIRGIIGTRRATISEITRAMAVATINAAVAVKRELPSLVLGAKR